MNKMISKKWIATLLVTLLTILGFGQPLVEVVAEEPLTDVIITKVDTKDDPKDMTIEQLRDGVIKDGGTIEDYFTDGKVLPGVSFTWYSVTKEQLATMEANPKAYDSADKVDKLVGKDDKDESKGTVVGPTDENGQVTIPDLAEGHYWVVENAKGTITSSRAVPFSLVLPFTNAEGNGYLRKINVYPKNTVTTDEPEIDKTIKEPNVAIGDPNIWTVSLKIPVGIEDYDKFSFYDEIDSRLDFGGLDHVIATAANINLIKGKDYTVAYAERRLDVEFTAEGRRKLKDADPKEVKVEIHTRVNETAIMGQDIPNDVTLEFNNGHGVDKEKTPDTPPTVHTGGAAFVKKDNANGGKVLEGAEFKIKNSADKFVNVGANGVITFVDEDKGTIFRSDAEGKFEVKGLPYGDYVLIETKAPKGYALPTNPETPFKVSANSYYEDPTQVDSGTKPADVIQTINNRKMTIPQTGGMGTALFTIIGAVIMVFSAVFYKKNKEA